MYTHTHTHTHTHTRTHTHTQLVYCLTHFHGDEKVVQYVHQLIDPSVDTEPGNQQGLGAGEALFGFTEDDYLALLAKNPETLFPDDSYMKHLRRHSTRYPSSYDPRLYGYMYHSQALLRTPYM